MEGHIPELDKMLGEEGSLGIEEDRPAVLDNLVGNEEGSLGIEEGRPAVLDNLVEVVGDDLCSKAKTEMIYFNNELYEPSII